MKKRNRTADTALCGVMAALSVVILLLGAVLGLGIYLAPMVAGLLLVPVGRRCGVGRHLLLWVAVSILAFLLVPEVEEDLMYAALFGCYPILYPRLRELPRGIRVAAKLLFFNMVFLGVELFLMWVLVPQAVEPLYLALLLLLGNAMFLCYDRVIPIAVSLMERYLGKIFKQM